MEMNSNYNNNMMNPQQRDIVLSPNEYVFVQNNTNGSIKTYTGPITITISAQDSLVVFDEKSKKFKTVQNLTEAKSLFVLPPENWYAIVKNPTKDGSHPNVGAASVAPELLYGRKVNIRGPVSFALYPGQMAKVVKGHALRTNQYLLARVYEADEANKNQGKVVDAEGKEIENTVTNCVNGQILVIKGTDISFYIPPTGIEVIPINNDANKGYVREAVTLERLEYCILKDEDGNKRYVHGPKVVFPEPTETFVTSPKGGFIFRAIELSKISGIYVKVIAEYDDEDGTHHPVGEELFITGDDQMIYYPRPEHAIISYDNKLMHHAIAIPEGEGRYIMNRLTGEINTVKGPAMYLPDPRTEVVVKRKLTNSQCALWYPGNNEALEYNRSLNEKAVEKGVVAATDVLNNLTAYSASYSTASTLANLEAKANISRGTSYTKPRTITLDNKYDGVVSIDVWTGYAVDVVSKNGDRKVICGPQTILLDYDQTLEVLQMSTGKPKTTDRLIKTVFLRHENNKISDIIEIETKDFVKANIKVSYCVSFDRDYMNKWFSIDNYVKYLCDRERSIIKRMAKNYTIEEFYQNYSTLIRNYAIDDIDNNTSEADSKKKPGRFFKENGMFVYDCEVLDIDVDNDVEELLLKHQNEMIAKSLELSDAERRIAVISKLAEAEQKEQELRSQQVINKLELQRTETMTKLDMQSEANRKKEAEQQAIKQAECDMSVLTDALHDAKLMREKKETDAEIAHKQALAAIEKAKQEAYADTVKKVMNSIQPGLIEALMANGNTNLMKTIADGVAPYALANNESSADVVDRLMRGTTLEGIIKQFAPKKD
jgi:major vault protein